MKGKRLTLTQTLSPAPLHIPAPPGGELREIPKRPFGVYVLVFILLGGIFSAALEILRLHSGLEGIWISADQFDQLTRLFHSRQRIQQYGIDHAEDRRVGADAEG